MAPIRRKSAGKVTLACARLTLMTAVLERLPQGVEHGGGELAELVQEQDAVRGEAHLAGPHDARTAAGQRHE